MIDVALDLSAKYDIEETVRASGYYSDMDQYFVDSKIPPVDRGLEIFATNSTPEFYNMMMNLTVEGQTIDDGLIIGNEQLLPGEQIAMIMINKIIDDANKYKMSQTRNSSPCTDNYDAKMRECKTWLGIGTGLTIATAIIPALQFFSPLFAGATAVDYSNCSDAATSTWMRCMETSVY